jgi:hypothetical protein
MYTYVAPLTSKKENQSAQPDYHSVEFTLDATYPAYQFKLWHSESNSMFLLAKNNSGVLPQLKVGNVMPMKYYDACAAGKTEVHDTRIRQIVNETRGRFQGHCRIEIAMIEQQKADAAEAAVNQ